MRYCMDTDVQLSLLPSMSQITVNQRLIPVLGESFSQIVC